MSEVKVNAGAMTFQQRKPPNQISIENDNKAKKQSILYEMESQVGKSKGFHTSKNNPEHFEFQTFDDTP